MVCIKSFILIGVEKNHCLVIVISHGYPIIHHEMKIILTLSVPLPRFAADPDKTVDA